MKKLLNTLYVTSPGAFLSRDGESVVVKVEQTIRFRIPIHTLDSILCFGHVMCSPPMMALCGENNVTISFVSEYGRFLGRVQGPVSGNVLLRRQQYRRADDMICSAQIARALVIAKIANSRTVLLRAAREKGETGRVENFRQAARSLVKLLNDLKGSENLDRIRGIEGQAARIFFSVFQHLIVSQREDFPFSGRNRRPPLDNMNALLSFIYTVLRHDVSSALEGVGLDPAVGYLHRDRPGRPGLALDMMEEFRPVIADRLALSLVNRKQLKAKDFTKTESGTVLMNEKARKTVLTTYQKRKQEEIQHPFLSEKIKVGLLPHVQAMLLARFLRDDLDGYPAYIWK